MISRASVTLVISFAVFFLTLVIPSPSFTQEQRIRIGISQKAVALLPSLLAEEKGFYKKYGLATEHIYIRTALSLVALMNGDLDYLFTVAHVISGAMRGMPVRLVAVTVEKPQYVIVSKPEYRSLKDLKGKTLGVPNYGSTSHLMLLTILERHGLSAGKDVQILAAGDIQSQLAAVQKGQIETMMWTPEIELVARQHRYKVLLHVADFLAVPFSAIGVTVQKIQQRRDEVKRMILGTVEALHFMRINKAETIESLARWQKISREMATSVYESTIDTFSQDGSIDPSALRAAVALEMERVKNKGKLPPLSAVADMTLIEEVQREFSRRR